MIRKTFAISPIAGSLNEAERTVEFIVSTDEVDSDGEILDQSWDLTAYSKNPIVVFNHKTNRYLTAEEAVPVGRAIWCKMVEGHLEVKLKIADSGRHPHADLMWFALADGRLNAVSPGFFPKNARFELRDGKEILVLSDLDLREISLAPLPSNTSAVAKSLDSKDVDDDEKELRASLVAKARAQQLTQKTATPAAKDSMTDEEIAALRKEAAESKAALAIASAKAAEVEGMSKALKDRLVALEVKACERDVDGLMGKKLVPAQKAAFLKLRAKDSTLFEEIVGGLPDIGTLTRQETNPEAAAEKSVETPDGLHEAIEAMIAKGLE